MFGKYTKLMSLFTLVVLLTAAKLSAKDANGATLYMYGATIEAVAQDDSDEGILSNKQIKIINLGPIINDPGVDYAPTISADGKTLFYVSDKQGSIKNEDDDFSHDFWVAKKADRMDTIFNDPYNLDPSNNMGLNGVNTVLHEGAASIAADRQTLYFTACDRPDGLGNCDIYRTSIQGDQWGRPVNLGRNVNNKNFDSQPTITPDQSRIYFVSTREGPNSDGEEDVTNFDIWYSDYDFDLEEWGKAKNLEAINTPGRDVSPFIAADGVTLFFASDGHEPNYGGQDFYYTRYDAGSDTWMKPQNIGTPINTENDEQFITLPASGDIIYFSSQREDLRGAQGSFDIYMAFVPSFFKAVSIAGTVLDECTGEFIPARVSIRNPITGELYTDELNDSHREFEKIVTNDWYGDPKDNNEYINLEITAEHPSYGKRTIVQRIDKPGITNDAGEEGEIALEYNFEVTLGNRPVITPDVDKADYVIKNATNNPDIADFNGLVMEEVLSWDLYPLLNYVFFDIGSSTLHDRYIKFDSPSNSFKAAFTDTTIPGGTMDKYYHVLNIYGFRLNQYPDTKITLVGCNDNRNEGEKGNKELSKARAQTVYDYLNKVWNISEDRMTIQARNFPKIKSNPKDSMGLQENRRVEILCDNWEVVKPVFEKDPKTFPQPVTMNWNLENGIDESIIASRRIEIQKGGEDWKTLEDVGRTESMYNWDWKSEDGKYPKNEDSFTARLVVVSKAGKECISEPVDVPVMQVSSEQKLVTQGADTMYENYSLILFKFNSYDAGPLNEKIMNDYVYNRVRPESNVDVIGHTDVVGLYKTNAKLSVNRAKTVHKGIKRSSKGKYAGLEMRGVGEDEPLYDNNSPEGRFYNRTVQVLIKTPITAEK
jgi:outer membrane protein OmpA-like peptidoglycan-associated protein